MLLRSPSWHTSFFISCTFALVSINNIWSICISLLYLSETVPLFLFFFIFFSFLPSFLPSFLYSILFCVLLCVLLCVLRCVLLYTFFGVMLTFLTFFLFFVNLIFPILTPSLVNFSLFPNSFLPLSSLPFSPFLPSSLLISRFSLHLFLSSSITPPFRRNQCA